MAEGEWELEPKTIATDYIIPNRLFKFPQMDFEMAIWEMTSLLIAPKKVFKSIYYHVSYPFRRGIGSRAVQPAQVQLINPC